MDPASGVARLAHHHPRQPHQQHRAEIAAVKTSNARMVALAGDDARGTWQQLEILMRQWRAIEDLALRAGPFIYRATRSSLRAVALD